MPRYETNLTTGKVTEHPDDPVQEQPVVIRKVLLVTRFQAFAALYQAGLLSAIEGYMADPTTDFFTKLAWENAQEFRRDSPLVQSIGSLFTLSSSQLDDLFTFASTITA